MPEVVTEKKKEFVLVEGLFESLPPQAAKTKLLEDRNAFGRCVSVHSGVVGRVPSPFICSYGVKPVEGDASRTVAVIVKKEKIQDVCDTYREQVGLRAVLKQVQLGMVNQKSLSCIEEDGMTVDDTLVPAYVGDMAKIAEENLSASLAQAKKLGVDTNKITSANFEQLIKDTVAATIEAMNSKEGEK